MLAWTAPGWSSRNTRGACGRSTGVTAIGAGAGDRAGARAANPKIRVLVDYSQDFLAQDKCKELALDQIDKEVFGPILHEIRYDPDDIEVVGKALSDKGYGLTLGVHSRLEGFLEKVKANVQVSSGASVIVEHPSVPKPNPSPKHPSTPPARTPSSPPPTDRPSRPGAPPTPTPTSTAPGPHRRPSPPPSPATCA